jgi:hypothetical protein
MKFYIITDRDLREIARVVSEEARRPLLESIRNLMRDMRIVADDIAAFHKGLNTLSSEDAPPTAPPE